MILVIAEQRDGVLHPASWEAVVAAQRTTQVVQVLVAGSGLMPIAEDLATADIDSVLMVEHPLLEPYTPDGFVEAISQVVRSIAPDAVFLAHTYQSREFAPRLAARFQRTLVTDCVATKQVADRLVFVRPMFQGKFLADVAPVAVSPCFASFQIGAFRQDAVEHGLDSAAIYPKEVVLQEDMIRQEVEPPFQEAKQAVDLTQAERIVAVGRGIKSKDHIELVERLAAALGAEVAASRPICDSGWLPMDRQIGSSGQTVSPKLYLALGISGAIQHLVGMKGSRTIVAVNKDPDAPIFEVADFGIVGDLFEVVPAIISALSD